MMIPSFLRSMGCAVALPLCILVLGPPAQLRAATATNEAAVQMLQTQLPGGTTIPQADCGQLARAVTLAVRAHRADAPMILSVALTGGARKNSHGADVKRPCACVTRLLRAAITAAPEKASALLEVAMSLYPDCVDELETALQNFNDKNVVDSKDRDFTEITAVGSPAADAPQTVTDTDSNDPLLFGPLGGFGPGFPGSPGFIGSPPGTGIALPSPSPAPVTPVANQ